MQLRETRSKVIDDVEYQVTQLGAIKGSQVFIRLLKVIGPSLMNKGADIGNIVYGTEGYVVFTSNYGKAAAFDNSGNRVMEFSGGGDHFGNFLDAVRSRKRESQNADVLEGHLSSAMCHLGNISYRLGRSVPFNAKTKSFGDNKEAYDTLGRMEEHLTKNGVALSSTNYMVGPTLKLDPRHETFQHNAKASELLTREYRPGFVVPSKA